MSRAIFLSIFLHTLAIALIFTIFKNNNNYSTQNVKKISLSTIKIVKTKDVQAENRKNKAKGRKLKAKSSKLKAHKLPITSNQLPVTRKTKSKELRAKSGLEKLKAKSSKLKAQSLKPKRKNRIHKATSRKFKAHKAPITKKAKSKKLKVLSSKLKVKREGRKEKSHMRAKSHLQKQKAQSLKLKAKSSQVTNIKFQIYQAINSAKIYPRLAKKMHQQGRVYTCFTLNTNKTISNLTTSGASSILQKGARQTIKRAKQNFPTVQNPMHLCVTISYTLE